MLSPGLDNHIENGLENKVECLESSVKILIII